MTFKQAKELSLKMIKENFKVRWAVGTHYQIGQQIKYQHQDYVVIGIQSNPLGEGGLYALKPV